MPSMDKSFEKNAELVRVHLVTAGEVLTAYSQVIELGETAMKLAN